MKIVNNILQNNLYKKNDLQKNVNFCAYNCSDTFVAKNAEMLKTKGFSFLKDKDGIFSLLPLEMQKNIDRLLGTKNFKNICFEPHETKAIKQIQQNEIWSAYCDNDKWDKAVEDSTLLETLDDFIQSAKELPKKQ